MKLTYSALYRISTVNSARTLLLVTPSQYPLEMLSASITKESSEASQTLLAGWRKVTSLGTPTGTTITPQLHDGASLPTGVAALQGAFKANITASEPTYGAAAQDADVVGLIGAEGFSTGIGWYFNPRTGVDRDRESLIMKVGDTWGLYLFTTPSAPTSLVIRATFAPV